ncbi:MFS transporter [Oceanobacillus manasiensis]|uniref:MFS transporter n=1 Tax=Oceanobacillus manasiensis TaxID=586413 RepID=UPI0005A7A212|nr:MFS transporter [Oceanobacillus manasiensis]
MISNKVQKTGVTLWSLSFVFAIIANALLFMIFEMLLPTLPLFVNEIGGNATDVGLVTGVFMVSAILIRPFAGYLLKLVNKKYLLILGIIINAISTGMYYFADTVNILLIIRLVHGLGFGLATTYFATLVAEIIPKERRGEGMGYFGVGETVAISVGPMIGIMILEAFDYSRLFIGGLAVLLLAALMAALTKTPKQADGADEIQHLKVKILEKRVLMPALLTMLIGVAASGIMSFFSLYAIEKDFSGIGWFFFIIALASFLVRLVSGRLFDRHGPSVILIPGSILATIGFVVLYLAHADSTFYLAAVLYGLGFGAIFPAIQTWCINLVEEHEHEYAMSTFFNFFDFGIGGGSLLLGILAAHFSYGVVYLVGIAFYIVFLLLYLYILYNQRRGNNSIGGL